MKQDLFNRIPYDIFRKIMLYSYTRNVLSENEHTIYLPLLLPPILASHVCQSWRHALLSDPMMWTFLSIPGIKPDGIMELLRRSDSAALNVSLEPGLIRQSDIDDTRSMLFSLLQHIHRFKLLRVHIAPSIFDFFRSFPRRMKVAVTVQKVLSYIQKPAPQLETFFFYYDNIGPPLGDSFSRTLFSGDAPKLKHMHYQLSLNIRESHSPLFQNLSDLSLSLRHSCKLDPDLFLDLLCLSPRLKFLHIHLDRGATIGPYFERRPDHRIDLPGLQRLVLDVSHTHDIIDLILEYVTFPSNLKWHMAFRHVLFPHCPRNPLPLLLSKMPFASLSILFAPGGKRIKVSLEEKPVTADHINQFNDNTVIYLHDDVSHLMILWDISLMKFINPSSITRLVLEFEDSPRFTTVIFPTFLASLTRVESLTVKYTTPFFSNYYPYLSFLLALTLDMEQISDLQYPVHPLRESSGLVWVDMNPDVICSDSFDNSPLPCLYLRELTVEVKSPLKKTHMTTLRVCSQRRYEKGYPLKILVRYEHTEVVVESPVSLTEQWTVS